jgi:glutamate dehydrogenase
MAAGHGLTRAELSVLISYSKIDLKEQLLNSLVPDDDYLTRDMETAFPPTLVSKFSGHAPSPLKREIVSTQIANDLVNHMGITFVQRLKESTGMSPANVAGAYVIVRDIFHLPHWAVRSKRGLPGLRRDPAGTDGRADAPGPSRHPLVPARPSQRASRCP